jgi:hypothetical protein
LSLIHRMIEEAKVPLFHSAHIITGLMIADSVPALNVCINLVLPGPRARFGFKQPEGHKLASFIG